MPAVLLALLSSLSYGASDYLGGLKSRLLPVVTVLLVPHTAALLGIVATLAIAVGDVPDSSFLFYGMLAGVAEAIGLAALYQGLAVGKMSIVAAVAATAPVVPVVASVVTGDMPGALQWLGIVIAIGGISLLALGSASEDDPHALARPAVSIAYGLLTAVGLGFFLLAMDRAADGSVQWALIAARATTVGLFTIAFLLISPEGELKLTDWGWLALIGLLILVADSFYAVATVKGVLSVVAVLSSLYPVVTILLARFHLGERLSRQQVAGIAIVLVGAASLSVG
ncbi:MAG: DMT family transporter [Solirubrobacterales bacterium]|jgi:drug/metabolite transporter (DMT)-like permease|nr:DMT family transporter [Solirubrobacterales bacterium]